MYNNEEYDNEITRCISKKLITQNDFTNSTFLGADVLGCSIEPQGVVKATIDPKKGVVSFAKYDPAWQGEVFLNLETADGMGNNYINNYSVEFGGIGFDESYDDEEEYEEEYEMVPLSDEEAEEVEGGRVEAGTGSAKAVSISLKSDGKDYYTSMNVFPSNAYAKFVNNCTPVRLKLHGNKISARCTSIGYSGKGQTTYGYKLKDKKYTGIMNVNVRK